jgi:SlyX protein
MTEVLVKRIDALEIRAAYQDETIETLNKTITAQWAQLDGLKREIAELRERLADAESKTAEAPPNEQPPHY